MLSVILLKKGVFEAKNNKENCKSAEACHIESFDFNLVCNGLQPRAIYLKLPPVPIYKMS